MRFAMLKTKNNASIIAALGENCEVISVSGFPAIIKIDKQTRSAISNIVERNVLRRQIRFPALFNFAIAAFFYRAIYRLKGFYIYSRIYSSLAASGDVTALVFNGFLAPNAYFQLAAEKLNIPRLFLENGFFPHTMQADHTGINALSTLPREASFYDALSDHDTGENWPEDLVERASKLKDGAPAARKDSLPENYVFVPFQVPSDMQILALSDWITDMKHLYNEVLALAKMFEDRHFVIKEHPSFPLSVQGSVEKHPRIHFCNHGVTRELIEESDAVLTVNSTVGLEALTLGKKVITLGDAHYAVEGLTLRARNAAELKDAFEKLATWQPDTTRREKFVKFINNRYLLHVDRKNAGTEIYALLCARAEGTDAYGKLLETTAPKQRSTQ